MITVKPTSPDEWKYCTHCSNRAVWVLDACNPKIIQRSLTAVFCNKCFNNLKKEIKKGSSNEKEKRCSKTI